MRGAAGNSFKNKQEREMKKIVSILGMVIVMAAVGSVNAQLSINAAYISQEHTFDYRNGILDSLNQ